MVTACQAPEVISSRPRMVQAMPTHQVLTTSASSQRQAHPRGLGRRPRCPTPACTGRRAEGGEEAPGTEEDGRSCQKPGESRWSYNYQLGLERAFPEPALARTRTVSVNADREGQGDGKPPRFTSQEALASPSKHIKPGGSHHWLLRDENFHRPGQLSTGSHRSGHSLEAHGTQ